MKLSAFGGGEGSDGELELRGCKAENKGCWFGKLRGSTEPSLFEELGGKNTLNKC